MLIILAFSLKAQPEDFVFFNRKTFQLYEQQQWKALKAVGKTAIKAGFDYYYLNMRMGIASYQLKNYYTSSIYFRRALKQNPFDSTAIKYLYHTYLLTERSFEATTLVEKYPGILKDQSIRAFNFISNVFLEAGVKFSNKPEVIRNASFAYIGFTHKVFPRVHITQFYQRFTQGMNQVISRRGQLLEYQYNIQQDAYYLTASLNLWTGFMISPAFHYQHVNFLTGRSSNYLWALSASQYWRDFNFMFTFTDSHINQLRQNQYSGAITYYPLGNLDLFFSLMYTAHLQEQKLTPVLFQKAGLRVSQNIWIEGFLETGDMKNYSQHDGYLIYNQEDLLQNRLGGFITYSWDYRENLFLSFQQENRSLGPDAPVFKFSSLVGGVKLGF